MFPRFSSRGLIVAALFILLTAACVRIDLASGPAIVADPAATRTPQPEPTPVVWPTLSPRSTPMVFQVVNPVPTSAAPACALPDLPAGRHVSADGDTEILESGAVGRMACQIKRDSCAFNRLVGKIDPSIIFKREETGPYGVEDLLVHPAMVQPLTRLNQLVQAEWGGAVQLRVTDAYDSLLSHDPPESLPADRYSLHYEGRAADLTTWPIDTSLYPRLCALAVCAGFDWVHNEETHCHASIRAVSLCQSCGG